ncbi:unnamed protein product [Arabidopsis halleri]
MWYKLPFEDLGDKHPLWQNADVNKKKMQSAGRWMRELDVYVEKPVVEEFQLQSIIDENPSDGESDSAYEPEGEDEMSDDEAIDDEDGLSENSESADEDEVGEADIEVFNHDSYEDQIPDEDEVYPATDDSSGDEEEQAERLVRRNLPDGVFSLKQIFSSGQEFKQNVIRYVLKTRRNVVNDRWEKTRLGARCKEKGCGWLIYCAVENPIGKWMVKTFYDEHKCHPVGRYPEMSAPEIKGKHESPTKKQNKNKVSRKGRVPHCGVCGGAGHNSRKCPNESEENRAKRRRLTEETRNAAQLEAQDEAEMEAAMICQEEATRQEEAGTSAQREAEVHDISSTAPQGTQRYSRLLW